MEVVLFAAQSSPTVINALRLPCAQRAPMGLTTYLQIVKRLKDS
jgi:hypothetical protein